MTSLVSSMQTKATSKRKDDDRSVTVNDFQGKSFDIGQIIDLESKEKDLRPRKAITKKIFEIQYAHPSLRKVFWSCVPTDISGGGYPHHPPVNSTVSVDIHGENLSGGLSTEH